MKLRLVSLAALALVGQAHALNVADTNAALQIYVSGASATKNIIQQLFSQNCVAGTLTIYSSLADAAAVNVLETNTTTAGAGDSSNGASFNTYSCTLIAGNDFGVAAQNVAFHKRDREGSGYGVYPVAYNTPIKFMKIDATAGNCAATNLTSGSTTCSKVELKQPHGGVSDVEPGLFNPIANRPFGFEAAAVVDSGNFGSVTPVFQVGFGVPLSQKLYDDLQAEQVALGQIAAGAQPIVPANIITMMGRQGFDSSIAWKAMLPLHDGVARAGINGGVAFPNTNTGKVTICRRDVGSGTQATFNRFFFETPLNGAVTPAGALDSVAGAYEVKENASSGNVRSCLAAIGSTGYAFGVLSLDSGVAGATGWKFARIDANTLGRDTIKSGQYRFVFTSTVQTNAAATVNGVSSTDATTLINGFAQGARKPSNLAVLSSGTQNAVAAVGDAEDCFDPDSGNPIPFVWGDGTNANQKFCSRTLRLDSLDQPILVK